MRCIYIFVCVCALTFLSACIEQQDSRLESALNMAGTNKGELLKLLSHYRESDNQKYRAACFLIKNMPYYSFYEGEELQKISGITSKNGRNGTKWLNINTVRVSDDAKPKMLKKQRKAELSRRTVCKSLPAER